MQPDSREINLAQAAGDAIHAFVAFLCAEFGGEASPAQVLSKVPFLTAGRLPPVYRQSMNQRVVTASAAYFRLFPRRGWEFVGSEINVGEVRLDLLWRRGDVFQADELKSGSVAIEAGSGVVLDQAKAQFRAGRNEFGSAFEAVRVVLLMHPNKSYYLKEDGQIVRAKLG